MTRTSIWRTGWIALVAILVLHLAAPVGQADVLNDAVIHGADYLVDNQIGGTGTYAGSWYYGLDFSGPSVAGLARAYQLTGTAGYRTAAEGGGQFILNEAQYGGSFKGFYGDGAYALTRLSEISADPADNSWRTAVGDYYDTFVRNWGTGTDAYIDTWFTSGRDATSIVYDLARHTVAAHYVDAEDKALWRAGLLNALSDVVDTNDAPVMALGVAVWALAKTGPMDDTVVSFDEFDNILLANLPALLAGQQVADGPNAGSFYTKFVHVLGSGFTETTAMGTLGLMAAYEADPTLDYADEILAAQTALAGALGPNGEAYWQMGNMSSSSFFYLTGETLEVVPEPTTLLALACGAPLLLLGRRPAGRRRARVGQASNLPGSARSKT